MYNVNDILSKEQKLKLDKDKVNYDVMINNDKEMRDYVSIIFQNVTGNNNIQNIADTIVEYHNKHKEAK